jgi:hypothetical protein
MPMPSGSLTEVQDLIIVTPPLVLPSKILPQRMLRGILAHPLQKRYNNNLGPAPPQFISHMRQLLFDLPLSFSLNTANYKLFWPLIDSVYVIRKTHHVAVESRDLERRLMICRFKRAYNVAPSSSLGPRAGITKKSKK